jgi:alpha-L-fucosidase
MGANMNRRIFHRTVVGAAASAVGRGLLAQGAAHYEPAWDSLKTHTVPAWYQNAKLGIFIHWGLYSVPAWAPPTGEYGKVDPARWFIDNPYAEWYLNSLRITGSPTWKHHLETYGKDFDYYSFASTFNQGVAKWDPHAWGELFRRTGARYVVLTSKHHDGFRLWPSRVRNPKHAGPLSASRDLVGDLTSAMRAAGLKMGLYYSGGLDWTFTQQPIRNRSDLDRMVLQSEEYAGYANAHWQELMERYSPSVMWNDISFPKAGKIPQLFAQYYNTVPEGVINNRFGVEFADFTTPEYAKYDEITAKKWESCRGLGFSFGYNQVEGAEQVIAPEKLIALLIDIVSKNGNLLLNVGPKVDGSISDIQLDRLRKLGDWLAVNGEGIFDTRPWVRASPSARSGPEVRFTQKGESVYAFVLEPAGRRATIPGITAQANTRVRALGADRDSPWEQRGSGLVVDLAAVPSRPYALGLRITPAPRSAG